MMESNEMDVGFRALALPVVDQYDEMNLNGMGAESIFGMKLSVRIPLTSDVFPALEKH